MRKRPGERQESNRRARETGFAGQEANIDSYTHSNRARACADESRLQRAREQVDTHSGRISEITSRVGTSDAERQRGERAGVCALRMHDIEERAGERLEEL